VFFEDFRETSQDVVFRDEPIYSSPIVDLTDTIVTFDIAGDEAWQPEIAAPASLPEAPATSPEMLELAQSSHEAIDAELLGIFLEEAHEVLATIGEQSAVLAGDRSNVEALTTIRRSSHTLKGSGRMVGLNDMGEAAWALEQTLNMWLRQDMAVNSDLLVLIAEAHALFSRWVSALEQGSGAIPDPTTLVAMCELLRSQDATAVVQSLDAAPMQQVELPVAVADEAPSAILDLPLDTAWETQAPVMPVEMLPEYAPPIAEEVLFDWSAEQPAPAEIVPPEAVEPPPVQVPWDDKAQVFTDQPVPQDEWLRSTPEIAEIPPASAAPTLYDIFCDEARGHLQTLIAAYADLEANPQALTSFDMTRAAHTLGGIAATVGLMPLKRLALALEHALLRRDKAGRPDSIEGLETVRQAIITLEAMFAGLARQEAPEEQVQLISALEEVFVAGPEAEIVPSWPEAAFVEEDSVVPEPVAPIAETAAPTPLPAMPRLQDELDEQLLPIFLEEAQDQLRELTVQLRLWRGGLDSDAQPHAIARLLHTFKGNARMAGAMNLGEFTHLLESRVEDTLRVGSATPAFIDEIESGCDTLAQATERLRRGEPGIPEPLAAAPGEAAVATVSTVAVPLDVERDHDAETGAHRATLRVRADLIDRLVNEAGELSIARARIEGEMRGLKGSLLDLTENVIRLRRQLREIEIQAEGQIQARVAQAHDGQADFDPLELDRFTRFQELTRFMAESVNDVATVQQNLLKNLDDANAAIIAQARLNRGLQQELMGVRMMPFASQAERLFRIVRQTAKELGKRANFDIVGGQVELDRSVLDKMMAPLEHMLRNAVAHGIETRDERLGAGKSEIGEITVSLAQEGNEIILSMADDGRGLDGERIRARAEALGLLAYGEQADEALLYDLIFRPGFSTAGEVSQLAGRGVGMDVVKTEVSELGGRIEILSQIGRGTTFRLYLPLTLAVTQTLLLRVGTQMYAVPSTMIEQVLELKEEPLSDLRQRGEAEWMGNRYPFHFLPHLLGDAGAVPEAQRRYWILLLRSGSQRVAVQVDELRGNQEVVVKNIGAQLSRVVGIAGATVLGDGQVVLILNPVALASRAAVVSVQHAIPSFEAPVETAVAALPTVMVVDDSLTVRKITSRLLTREGYQVVLAKDGVDALEQLLETVPDVILSDIEMPRMDGFDLVRNIRADKRLSAVPVIMITSRTAEKHRNYALEIGASHYLGKPYDEDELLRLIAGYIKAKQLS
jgi:chemosensory pili system protein ChpA (sensor histidine kinase/response regulator)